MGAGISTSPPGNVRTDQGNTYTGGVQDLTLASGLVVPASAGLTLSALARMGFDTTQRSYLGHDGLQGQGSFPRVLSYQRSTSDTVTASVVGANVEKDFATNFLIKSGFFIAGKTLRLTAHFQILHASASDPNWQFGLRIGAAGGITGTLIWQNSAALTGGGGAAYTADWMWMWIISGTAAAGASVGVETALLGNGGSLLSDRTTSTVGSPVSVPTNADETLTVTTKPSNNTANTSLTLRQLIVEELN